MFCSNCGTQIPDGSQFCPSCGASLNDSAQDTSSQQAYQPNQQAYQPNQQAYQPYQQGFQPVQQPYYTGGNAVNNTPYLVWSIIVTILCCWPFGIPAIVNASRITKCNTVGDYAGASEAARKSKTWTIVSACVGFVLNLLYIIIYISD